MEVYTNRYNGDTKERKVIVVQVKFVIGIATVPGFVLPITCM